MSMYERTYVATSKDGDGNTYINYYPSKDNAVMQTDPEGKSLDIPISTPVFEDYSGEGTIIPELADALSAMISQAKMSDLLSNSKAALLRLKEQIEGIDTSEINLYLDANNWIGDATNGYIYTCEVTGITEEATPVYGLGNVNPTEAETTAFLLIDELRTETDTVILTATEKPMVDLIVTMKSALLNGTPVAGNLEEVVERVSMNESNINVLLSTYQKNSLSVLGTTLGNLTSGSGANLSLNAVTYGNDKYVATASTGVFYSTDGITWTSGTGGRGGAVVYGNNKFVSLSIHNGTGYYHVSTDGITWTSGNCGFSSSINDMAYGNGVYVAVGSGSTSVYYSTDGVTWSIGTGASIVLYGVIFANGRFVAVGGSEKATVYYSTNGKSWSTSNNINSTEPFNDVAYGNGKFVGVGFNGYTAYSTDGVTWASGSGIDSSVRLTGVAYANGKFVAVGNTKNYVSDNGIAWTPITNIGSLSDITYGNGKFVAVGNSGLTNYLEFSKETKKIEDIVNELYALLR